MGLLARLAALFGMSSGAALAADTIYTPPEAATRKLRDAFPFRIMTVAGRNALAEWDKLQRQGNGWPVIVGDDDALFRVMEQYSIDDPVMYPPAPDADWKLPAQRSVEEILEAADAIDISAKLQDLQTEWYGEEPIEVEQGDWPEPGSMHSRGTTVDKDVLSGKPFERVHIVVLPTDDPTTAAAHLRWGNWNACPVPEVHVAMHREWREEYGAQVVGMSGDVIDMRVAKRPASREEAMALAREQYLYCSDIVLQGTDTLERLAASLMESDWWYFWWD